MSAAFLAMPAIWQAPADAASDAATLDQAYQSEIRPIIGRYCGDCHGSGDAEADLHLATLSNWAEISREPRTWQKVRTMLRDRLMPPDGAEQLTDSERTRVEKWINEFLAFAAKPNSGDPGRVVLRRLNNAEYTHTLRDLTGLEAITPAQEFPVDGAAGEGFTNTGNSLVMSPMLVTKYLDSAKEIASHVVLLPDGFRFSLHNSRRDWTDDLLAQIRGVYGQFVATDNDANGTSSQASANDFRGEWPLSDYLSATQVYRNELSAGTTTIDAVARAHRLSPKYLGILWSELNSHEKSAPLDDIRSRWRNSGAEEARELAKEIFAWQKILWRFNSVGLIGREGGPNRWMEPVNPIATEQEIKLRLPDTPDNESIIVSLVVSDAMDGSEHDFVVIQRPRLVLAGRPDLMLGDVAHVAREFSQQRSHFFQGTAKYLAAAAAAMDARSDIAIAEIARRYDVDATGLQAWLNYLGIRGEGNVDLNDYLVKPINSFENHESVDGWGDAATPLLIANASDKLVRLPGALQPNSTAVHPSALRRIAVGWRSPIDGKVNIEASIADIHHGCGNGVTWSLELRRGTYRRQLASGSTTEQQGEHPKPVATLAVHRQDVISLVIGPNGGNHFCDLTEIELQIGLDGDEAGRSWSLRDDVVGNPSTGNPHSDRYGNEGVWHFYTEPDQNVSYAPRVPEGSFLSKWQSIKDESERLVLADKIERLLTSDVPNDDSSPDALMYRELRGFTSPLLSQLSEIVRPALAETTDATGNDQATILRRGRTDVEQALFGRAPAGTSIGPDDICLQAPAVLELQLPAELAAGSEFVASCKLADNIGKEGSVQFRVVSGKSKPESALWRGEVVTSIESEPWTSRNHQVANSIPIVVTPGSNTERRIGAELDGFRQLFPAALCYTKLVPTDEAISLIQFYREDDHLSRLMLNDKERARLDNLWDELHFVSQDALTTVDAFAQLLEYATQDADPKVFERMRQPIEQAAADFRQRMVDSEAKQFNSLIEFSERAYRRPLNKAEVSELRSFYEQVRAEDVPHEEAFRTTLARVLIAPAFLYRIEVPPAGKDSAVVSDHEMACRLSYFLWATMPDESLRAAADAGELHDEQHLVSQLSRMLRDRKTRQLAEEFGCQWLHIHDFSNFDEKSERHFPTFSGLRNAMFEETALFFTDLFQHDRSILNLLDADYTFLTEDLAKHYGIPDVVGTNWRRVEGVNKYSRGGVLAMATTLSTQSGASRTSPILRGTWVSEVILGEELPKPPKGVPPLPDDEVDTSGLTMRQLVEKHVSDPKCMSCHQRFDAYGFALEAFDAIGRYRQKDLGDRLVDTRVVTMDGAQFEGLNGLRDYLKNKRRGDFVRQFCRKLLGYALGRAVQLSDEPLLGEMQNNLAANDYRVSAALETIVTSKQFREIRGRDNATED